LPSNHKDIAISLNNLGIVLQAKGEYAEAGRFYQESLRLRRQLWGRQHRDVAVALSNLGTLLEDMEKLGEAEVLYREALAIRQRLLGEAHLDTLVSMEHLAAVLNALERRPEAEALVQEALELTERSRNTSGVAAQLLGVLGECRWRAGRFVEAEEMLLESYARIRDEYSERERPRQLALKRIVELYRAWGRQEQATRYEQLLAPHLRTRSR
jgi:tetratricopeptide (TPR) repeat protein